MRMTGLFISSAHMSHFIDPMIWRKCFIVRIATRERNFWSFIVHTCEQKWYEKIHFFRINVLSYLSSLCFIFFHIPSICETCFYLFWPWHSNFIRRKMWKDPSSNHWSYEMQHVSIISRLRLGKNCEKRKGNFAPSAVETFK